MSVEMARKSASNIRYHHTVVLRGIQFITSSPVSRLENEHRFYFRSDLYNLDVVNRVASSLKNLVQSWPHELPLSKCHRIVMASCAVAITDSTAVRTEPKYTWDRSRERYTIFLTGIDPESGKHNKFQIHATLGKISPTSVREILDLQIGPVSELDPEKRDLWIRTKSSSSGHSLQARQHEAAIRLLKHVVFKFHKKIMRLVDLKCHATAAIYRHQRRERCKYIRAFISFPIRLISMQIELVRTVAGGFST